MTTRRLRAQLGGDARRDALLLRARARRVTRKERCAVDRDPDLERLRIDAGGHGCGRGRYRRRREEYREQTEKDVRPQPAREAERRATRGRRLHSFRRAIASAARSSWIAASRS